MWFVKEKIADSQQNSTSLDRSPTLGVEQAGACSISFGVYDELPFDSRLGWLGNTR